MLESDPRVLRPANFGDVGIPGRGLTFGEARDGTAVAVLNLQGQLFLPTPVHPFRVVDALVEEARAQTPVILVDFHAEATSEKIALARLLDGRVTAVLGTHTHVQTNDARVLPGGTAAITDAGMTGPHDSVIGVRAELAIQRMQDRHPGALPPGRGGRPHRRRARRVRHRRARYALRGRPRARSIATTSTTASATRSTLRTSASQPTGCRSTRSQ